MENVKDQVYIQQLYLAQVIKKHCNLENVLICFQRMQVLLFIEALRILSLFINKNVLLLCGDIKNFLVPLMLPIFYDVIFGAENGNKFLIFYAGSIQNKDQEISNLLQQLDSDTIATVTETWMSEEQSLKLSLSAELILMHKNRSHQTRAIMGGGVGKWIPKKVKCETQQRF